MGRPKNAFPTPSLRRRNDSWQIRWRLDGEEFSISLGNVPKDYATATRAAITVALAKKDDWPVELVAEPAVKRYLAKITGNNAHADDSSLIEQYHKHMTINSKSSWPRTVKAHLNAAASFTGNLMTATPPMFLDFLNTITEANSIATRNRAFASLSGFYRWLRLKHILPKGYNPLDGIGMLKEERPQEGIVIWEKTETTKLLKAADSIRGGIAVWIAVHAGLRRSEIARLRWDDITPAYIIVRKSKTDTPRQIPLSKTLAKRLEKEIRTSPRVAGWPEAFHGWETAAGRIIYEKLPDALPKIKKEHPEKFGWNAFRHTFASRHAQAGIPIDVIAAWLGDSPKVCKEHYARYVPANRRDTRIDIADGFSA